MNCSGLGFNSSNLEKNKYFSANAHEQERKIKLKKKSKMTRDVKSIIVWIITNMAFERRAIAQNYTFNWLSRVYNNWDNI